MKVTQRPVKRARIEIIPMIDVIFFLLVFFMISSLALTKVNSIKVALPKTSASPEILQQKTVLSVKANGEIFVNQSPVTLDRIGPVLAEAMHADPQGALLVNADEGANYGLVIRAMDQARLIGVRKFALSTEPHGSPH